MRTTVDLDENLVNEAREVSGIKRPTALIQAALRALIERESAKKLAKSGGSEPRLRPAARRRSAG
jgi:Arc/MetJ family transcription regulator